MPVKDQQSAEEEIFRCRKRIDMYLQAGQTREVSRLQFRISQLQKKYGAVKGAGGEKENERTA